MGFYRPSSGESVPNEIVTMVDKYELTKNISFSELAVRKAVCIVAPVESAASDDYHSWLKWTHTGWNVDKASTCRSPAISVIKDERKNTGLLIASCCRHYLFE
jgi:hypothetical protein